MRDDLQVLCVYRLVHPCIRVCVLRVCVCVCKCIVYVPSLIDEGWSAGLVLSHIYMCVCINVHVCVCMRV